MLTPGFPTSRPRCGRWGWVGGSAVAGVVLIRADDHLVLGVRWSGFQVSGAGAGTTLTAGAQARLFIVLPPQHVGEESSPPGSAAPQQLPSGVGATVPAWRGVLSGPTRLTFQVAAGKQIPLTAEGVLSAVVDNPLVASPDIPGQDDTAIELPWRLVIAPRGRSSGTVVCRHQIRLASADSSGLWRTRLSDTASATDTVDADLDLRVVDKPTAEAADPTFAAEQQDSTGKRRPRTLVPDNPEPTRQGYPAGAEPAGRNTGRRRKVPQLRVGPPRGARPRYACADPGQRGDVSVRSPRRVLADR